MAHWLASSMTTRSNRTEPGGKRRAERLVTTRPATAGWAFCPWARPRTSRTLGQSLPVADPCAEQVEDAANTRPARVPARCWREG